MDERIRKLRREYDRQGLRYKVVAEDDYKLLVKAVSRRMREFNNVASWNVSCRWCGEWEAHESSAAAPPIKHLPTCKGAQLLERLGEDGQHHTQTSALSTTG